MIVYSEVLDYVLLGGLLVFGLCLILLLIEGEIYMLMVLSCILVGVIGEYCIYSYVDGDGEIVGLLFEVMDILFQLQLLLICIDINEIVFVELVCWVVVVDGMFDEVVICELNGWIVDELVDFLE